MADIAMCTGSLCLKRKKCYRFTAKAEPFWQSYIFPDPENYTEFWDNTPRRKPTKHPGSGKGR